MCHSLKKEGERGKLGGGKEEEEFGEGRVAALMAPERLRSAQWWGKRTLPCKQPAFVLSQTGLNSVCPNKGRFTHTGTGLSYRLADLESSSLTRERREPPRGRRCWRPRAAPLIPMPSQSSFLPGAPGSVHLQSLKAARALLCPLGPAEPPTSFPGISPSLLPARARCASMENKPASKQLTLPKPACWSSLLPEPLLV